MRGSAPSRPGPLPRRARRGGPRAVLAVLAALAPGIGAAAPFDGTQRIDAPSGLALSSARVIGLGGAFVAVAEGLEGAAFNPAAVAHRDRTQARDWDWDFLVGWFVPAPDRPGTQDIGDEGRTGAGLSGRVNVQLGLGLQLGRLGLGAVGRAWSLAAPGPGGGTLELGTREIALDAAFAFWREQLLLGAGSVVTLGEVAEHPAGLPKRVATFQGASLHGGALWQPRGWPLRAGLLVAPGSSATPKERDPALGVAVPTSFAFPPRFSVGLAAWLGPDADLLNEPPPATRDRPDRGEGPAPASPDRPVLVSAQLDVVGRSRDAVSLGSFFRQAPTEEALVSGRTASLAFHFGAEWEALVRWLVLRAGGYGEPSRTGASWRPHGTFGAEVRLPLGFTSLRLGVGGDVARQYRNVGLSLGLWKDLGPHRS